MNSNRYRVTLELEIDVDVDAAQQLADDLIEMNVRNHPNADAIRADIQRQRDGGLRDWTDALEFLILPAMIDAATDALPSGSTVGPRSLQFQPTADHG